MTADLPAPPVAGTVDLSALGYMPLMIADLLRSNAWRQARRRPELGFYLVNLWMAAFWGKPAGSLPDDDDALADLAKCPLERWPEVKDAAMHGFVRCADGHWYHSYLCAQVIPVAVDRRLRWRERKQRQRASLAKVAPAHDGPVGHAAESRGTAAPVPRDAPLRDGTRRDREEDSTAPATMRSPHDAAATDATKLPEPDDAQTSINTSASASASRGTRLAPDWRPAAAEQAFAARLGLDADRIAAEFRDYWHAVLGARGRKLDWPATFRNRCRVLAGGSGTAGAHRAGGTPGAAGIAGAAARVIARRGLA
ncbi:DUF1376 domain-containing protein [Vineibacter terrae]|nr:DUF1376 domain-containing protein [Vineibacter terrae]